MKRNTGGSGLRQCWSRRDPEKGEATQHPRFPDVPLVLMLWTWQVIKSLDSPHAPMTATISVSTSPLLSSACTPGTYAYVLCKGCHKITFQQLTLCVDLSPRIYHEIVKIYDANVSSMLLIVDQPKAKFFFSPWLILFKVGYTSDSPT